jgi:hypothetical protein
MILFFLPAFADPLPDLAPTLSRVSCESPATAKISKAMPGAEQFYTGAFRIEEGGSIVGIERRYTYANSSWKAKTGLKQGHDCVDVWNVVGTKTEAAGRCEGCAFGITIQADVDVKKTTCERRLTADGNHFRTAYDVKVAADGSFELFFPSGKPLGKGKRDGEIYSWRTDQACIWF